MAINSDYLKFLASKERYIPQTGFKVNNLNPMMKDFQKFSVKIALDKGRFALFEDCGLGKTLQQLEFGNQVVNHTGNPFLILSPLAVVNQTIEEGRKFGIEVNEVPSNIGHGVYITNYEQLPNINASMFSGVALDESSILKNFDGAYRNQIIGQFSNTRFKLSCSATPSPNDPMELGNQAEFLGVMNYNEMLATYFTHDGGETAKWRLKGHAKNEFWRWVNTWSLLYSKPSDIGFSDEGYILPELKFIERKIITPTKSGLLFNDIATSATDFHREVRLTKLQRLSEVVDIVNNSNESFIIWIEQNAEGDYLRKHLKDAIEVKGSDSDEYKKDMLLGFAHNKFSRLITKPKIASMGLNYQNCHNQIFCSPDHSYEKMYQAIRRSLRYGQQYDVNVYLIVTDTMSNVIASFKKKQAQHMDMHKHMIINTKELYEQYYIAA